MQDKFTPGKMYYIPGGTLVGLLRIASELSSGNKIDADKRRDMGQWIQAQLDSRVEAPPQDIWE